MACRENNWSLESATFYTEVTEYQNPDEIEERPKIGCYASDILIEGADWAMSLVDRDGAKADGGGGCLVRAKLRNSINRLPIIRIIPVEMHKLKLQVRGRGRGKDSGEGSNSGCAVASTENKWQIAIIIMTWHEFGQTGFQLN